MILFEDKIVTPEEQSYLNRNYLQRKRAEYVEFCRRLKLSLGDLPVNFSDPFDLVETIEYSVVVITFAYWTEGKNKVRFTDYVKISTEYFRKIGNPIPQLHRDFVKRCKETERSFYESNN